MKNCVTQKKKHVADRYLQNVHSNTMYCYGYVLTEEREEKNGIMLRVHRKLQINL